MDNQSAKRKRGPYKKYLHHGSTEEIPKRTLNYWKARESARQLSNTTCNLEDPVIADNEISSEAVNRDTDTNSSGVLEHISIETNPDLDQPVHLENNHEDFSDEDIVFSSYDESSDESVVSSEEDINTTNSLCNQFYAGVSDDEGEKDGDEKGTEEEKSNEESSSETFMYDKYPIAVMIRTLLVLAFKLKFNVTNEAAENVIKLTEALNGEHSGFTSLHHLKKIINHYSIPIQIHHLCPNCRSYIGEESIIKTTIDNNDEAEQKFNCPQCRIDVNIKENRQSSNIFLYLSLAEQLKEFFERYSNSLLCENPRKKLCSYAIEDISDGKPFNALLPAENHESTISLNFSVDGAPLFKSSNTSIIPIVCTINELQVQLRKQHILLCSLYIGSKKPDMNEYIKPFVAEATALNIDGFEYVFKGITYRRKCRILLGICDSVERPELRCSSLFRSAYGCGLCKHEGKIKPKGKGHVRVYPIDDDGNAFGEGLRSHAETLQHAVTGDKGIKRRSNLCDIPNFDIIHNLDVDWMHCVALGVCRQFANLWFDSSNHEKEFYFNAFLPEIDNYLLTLKPSKDISRTPRKISERAHWKAHEWVAWLLYYSLPILRSLFPMKFVSHWSLLVDGISILVKSSILQPDVYYSRQCLFRFVKDIENLYGIEYTSFNVHLLTHLPESVLNWGPLWAHNAFMYEDYYQILLNFVKSSNAANLQILECFRSKLAFEKLFALLKDGLSADQLKYLEDTLNPKKMSKPSFVIDEVALFGSGVIIEDLPTAYDLALQRINITVDSNCLKKLYSRIVINKEVIHCIKYTRVTKRNSYTVLLINSQVFKIEIFLVVQINNVSKCFAIGRYYNKCNPNLFPQRQLQHLIYMKRTTPTDYAAVDVLMIKEKITVIPMPKKEMYVGCIHPNRYELLS